MREPKKIAAIKNIRERRVLRIQKRIIMSGYENDLQSSADSFARFQRLKNSFKYDSMRSHHERLGAEGAGAIRNAADRLIQWLR